MVKKMIVPILLLLTSMFLISCSHESGTTADTLLATPSITIMPVTKSPQTPVPAKTPTENIYKPYMRETELPFIYEPISSRNSPVLIAEWYFQTQYPNHLAFTYDGTALVVGSEVWRLSDGVMIGGTMKNPFFHSSPKPLISSSPDGRFLAKINERNHVEINLLESTETGLYYYTNAADKVGFFPDGEYLVLTFKDGRVWFISVESWAERLIRANGTCYMFESDIRPEIVIETQLGAPNDIYVSQDQTIMVFVFEKKTIQIWSGSELRLISTIQLPEIPTNVAFDLGATILAISSDDHIIRLWDIKQARLFAELEGHESKIKDLSFSPDGRFLASLSDNWVNIWGNLTSDIDPQFGMMTATSLVNSVPVLTTTPASLPKPTSTPSSSLPEYRSFLPWDWPIKVPSKAQIDEAKSCSVEAIAASRYPSKMPFGKLESSYRPQTGCDWAALALAYVSHSENTGVLTEEGKMAFAQAVKLNLAYASKFPLFYYYFNSLELVDPPPSDTPVIKSIVIDYQWMGIGEPSQISYHVDIQNAHLCEIETIVSVQVDPSNTHGQYTTVISPTLIQTIHSSLVDFIPSNSPFTLDPCTDNEPNWHVLITYIDGTSLTLDTYQSDLITLGGPWQIQVDGQNYFQFSTALMDIFSSIFEYLNLPLGEPWAMYCESPDVITLAYP